MTRAPAPAARSGAEGPADVGELLHLRPGVFTATGERGERYLLTRRFGESIGDLTDTQRGLLRTLAAGPVTAAQLAEESGLDPQETAGLLARLRRGGWLVVTVTVAGRPAYTLTPHGRPPPVAAAPPGPVVLSRFVVVHRTGPDFTVEMPRSWCTIRLHDPALLAVLGEPSPPRALPSEPSPEWPSPGAAAQLVHDLWSAGMTVDPGVEEGELQWRQWSPHELWFHHRSRTGHHQDPADGDFGGTWWAQGEFDPLPARPAPFPGPAIDLLRPDPAVLRRTDPPLAAVVDDRRSTRVHEDEHPLALEQVGELLYRCGRNRGVQAVEGVELQQRPYPSGGGLYELELYLVVRLADGLPAGMYHYDSHEHRLVTVCGPHRSTRLLLESARTAAGMTQQPQLLLVVSARFGRLMWKYQQLPYALILKHVGVVYQNVYLAATALGIAVCGLGSGDIDAFAAATGRDPLLESSVGEMALGSLPPGGEDR